MNDTILKVVEGFARGKPGSSDCLSMLRVLGFSVDDAEALRLEKEVEDLPDADTLGSLVADLKPFETADLEAALNHFGTSISTGDFRLILQILGNEVEDGIVCEAQQTRFGVSVLGLTGEEADQLVELSERPVNLQALGRVLIERWQQSALYMFVWFFGLSFMLSDTFASIKEDYSQAAYGTLQLNLNNTSLKRTSEWHGIWEDSASPPSGSEEAKTFSAPKVLLIVGGLSLVALLGFLFYMVCLSQKT